MRLTPKICPSYVYLKIINQAKKTQIKCHIFLRQKMYLNNNLKVQVCILEIQISLGFCTEMWLHRKSQLLALSPWHPPFFFHILPHNRPFAHAGGHPAFTAKTVILLTTPLTAVPRPPLKPRYGHASRTVQHSTRWTREENCANPRRELRDIWMGKPGGPGVLHVFYKRMDRLLLFC